MTRKYFDVSVKRLLARACALARELVHATTSATACVVVRAAVFAPACAAVYLLAHVAASAMACALVCALACATVCAAVYLLAYAKVHALAHVAAFVPAFDGDVLRGVKTCAR